MCARLDCAWTGAIDWQFSRRSYLRLNTPILGARKGAWKAANRCHAPGECPAYVLSFLGAGVTLRLEDGSGPAIC